MAKKHRGHEDEAWRNAKTICRLNARQVDMARALGMNPRKLPGLRPSAHERWKLPVGAFIERNVAKSLDSGALISAIPEILLPPRRARTASARRDGQKRTFDDEDEIPF